MLWRSRETMMRKLLAGLLAVLVVAAAAMVMAEQQGISITDKDLESEESMWNLYERWRAMYATVSVVDLTEKKARFDVFKAKTKHIYEFNKKKDTTYKLGLNKFSDLTDKEFVVKYTGGKPGSAAGLKSGDVDPCWLPASAPTSLDWREDGVVTPVKDQGPCGSCWAFGAVGAVESVIAIKTGILLTLSEQQVLDCSGDFDSCYGGYPYDALYYAKNNGINLDQCGNPPYYPAYEAVKEPCRFNSSKTPIVKIDEVCVLPYTDEATLKLAVSTEPVAVIIDASGDFPYYTGGVYDGTCNSVLDGYNHVVLVVGYGETEDGLPYWIIKNSWGENWGEKGYIRMIRDVPYTWGKCAITTYPIYPFKKCPCYSTASAHAALAAY